MPIYTDYTERPVVPMPRRYNSADTKRRILSACVRLFIEKGYKSTTMMEIQREADVTSSSFQNIFHTKSGVLLELVRFMFTRQFGAARSYTPENVPPVYIYAVETAIQLTLAEQNENLREIYVEAYTHPESCEYICRLTAKELHRIFGSYLPAFTEEDFYELDVGTAGLMRGYMARRCGEDFPLERKLDRFLDAALRIYNVPRSERENVCAAVTALDICAIADHVMQELFQSLPMQYHFTLSTPAAPETPAG